jgi:secondary thiamine-phosphate synthase enzyme
MWIQQKLTLSPKSRGFHIITAEILQQLPQLNEVKTGILHLFMQHTSASLSINENADPSVRYDLEMHLNHIIPENAAYYLHSDEGEDDMPAHIKASLLGNNLSIPIACGRLLLGTWQGIYLGEHRNHGGNRSVIATINGASN